MRHPPEFFESVRRSAAERWDQLEQDPDLAGPWHQLFRQVQSPRHVLSELLQNADDVGATEASVRIENRTFTFEHNGKDFSREHFASICRFGYSNKRTLHTIGFRGIGFKSTFSLGECVKLFTPSLSVCFRRGRFTEPHWLAQGADDLAGKTRVVVEVSDRHRQREIEKNLEDWLKSPVSLLFFNNIRLMRIGDQEVQWGSLGPGPISDSEWVARYEDEDKAYLLVRSEAEPFPEEALAEIRQERMLGIEEETEFPPCRVEIVLGAKGRLYVVLPTGVETALPFASNAPFIQDPARLTIRSPETSPTNSWLLERVGKLAGSAMLRWLGSTDMPTIERVRAYGLLPDVDRDDTSLEGVCSTAVEQAFEEKIEGHPLLLTEDGDLVREKQSVAIPGRLFDIWPADLAAAIFDEDGRPALNRHVEPADLRKLVGWDIVDQIGKQEVLETLRDKPLPQPETWRALLILWTYVASEITGYRHRINPEGIRIVPVQGKDVLYASSEVVRLGEKRLLQSDNDWEFLAGRLTVLNQNWSRFLAEQQRIASKHSDTQVIQDIQAAYAVLEKIKLDDTSDANEVIDQFAVEFFSQDDIGLQDCVRLAQIVAKLGVSVGEAFRYATSDGNLRPTEEGILFDADGDLRSLLTVAQQDLQILHSDYTAEFSSCSCEDWHRWVLSGRAGLHTFMPFVTSQTCLGRRQDLDRELQKRGFKGSPEHRYKDPLFYIRDWDFDEACWKHWQRLGTGNPKIWSVIARHILSEKESYWSGKISAQIVEEASNGYQRTLICRGLVPSWALKLRDLPCLPDTHGVNRNPGELFRFTSETKSLIDVEPFVEDFLDREDTRPLLDLIGVQSTPTGPERLLDRLRALARAEAPPVREVEKWYRRLDHMVNTCPMEDLQKISQAFDSEKLILTRNGIWEATASVFQSSDKNDVPDAELVRASVGELTLWNRIGVADRPTAEHAIKWLKKLPAVEVLEKNDARRVRSLLARHPARIWRECGHWLNLAGGWTPVCDLSYSLTMQSLVPWEHLHQRVKRQTADLQRLSIEVTTKPPFSELRTLATQIQERLRDHPLPVGVGRTKEWLEALGAGLSRIKLETDEETERIRCLASRLVRTKWCETSGLEIIPYIDNTPAGTLRQVDVLWLDEVLYLDRLPKAKLARRVPEEVGKAFDHPDIKATLSYSFERSAEDVREYLEENFALDPAGDSPGGSIEETEQDQGKGLKESGSAPESEEGCSSDSDTIEPENEIENDTDVGTGLPQPPRPPRPSRPGIMERYAASQGFWKESNGRFYHKDGSSIIRTDDGPFPWERRTAEGTRDRRYWPKDHCLEDKPLQVPAEVWDLMVGQRRGDYALILVDAKGRPVEVADSRLGTMCDTGEVTLYPATYRLVWSRRAPT